MVFFVCEGCNETLKKNQVDKHAYSCRSCHAVTCVDCSVTFYGNDYAAHITCISEAEKYEGSLYKPKAAKLKPQDIWNALIEEVVGLTNEAPSSIRPYLNRLSSLTNVPRNKKKFLNFAKNSLNLRSDAVLEDLWNFLDSVRQKREASQNDDNEKQKTNASEEKKDKPQTDSTEKREDTTESKEEKKSKKKKREREEEVETTEATEVESNSKKQKLEEPQEEKKEKKEKKDKKEKKEKKHKKEKEAVST
eukprot:gene1248-1323_t